MNGPPQPLHPESRDRRVRKVGAVALGFVLLTLLVLAVVPVLLQRRIDPLRRDVIEAAEPARTLVNLVQFALARQMSSLRGYLLTGDDSLLAGYRADTAREKAAYGELRPLAVRLGPEVLERFARLRALSGEWHVEMKEDALVAGYGTTRGTRTRASTEEDLYVQVLRAANDLDHAIAAAAQERRTRIQAAERTGMRLTTALLLLASAAAAALGWLARRVSHLARESELRRLATEEALAERRRADEAHARLLRGITHDVKNPLGAADGYAELLELEIEGPLAAGQAKMVAGIRRSVAAALAIVCDLLDLTRADAGTLPVRRAEVDLVRIVREVAAEHEGAVRTAGHSLEVRLPDGELEVFTDADRVCRILANLLSNAVKYTPPPGHIRVEACGAGSGGPAGTGRWAEVRVTDSGPGIPPGERERIFDEFHRLHPDSVQGHGLGLAISRRTARLLGGDVTVESRPGEGATFVVRLPVRAGAEEYG